MVLAVDIGNTNIVIGAFDADGIVFTERLSTAHLSTELEYTVLVQTVLELNRMQNFNRSGIVSDY